MKALVFNEFNDDNNVITKTISSQEQYHHKSNIITRT
jgi:hypothetical protein